MQDHGHKLSPPKTKRTAVTNITTAVFRITTHSARQKCTTLKPRSFISKLQCRTKLPFPMTLSVKYGKSIRAGLLTRILRKETFAASCPEPSQFPNDRLSSEGQNINAYSDRYRHGFSPCSLFTAKAFVKSLCSLGDTLCDLLNLSMTFIIRVDYIIRCTFIQYKKRIYFYIKETFL